MNEFLKSDTMFAYNRMMSIMSMEDLGNNISNPELSGMEFERLMQMKRSIKRLQGIMGEKPLELEDDENLDDADLLRIETVDVPASNFEKARSLRVDKIKTKEEISPTLSPDRVEYGDGEDYN
jgi:hypothetical protein